LVRGGDEGAGDVCGFTYGLLSNERSLSSIIFHFLSLIITKRQRPPDNSVQSPPISRSLPHLPAVSAFVFDSKYNAGGEHTEEVWIKAPVRFLEKKRTASFSNEVADPEADAALLGPPEGLLAPFTGLVISAEAL